MIPLHSNIQHNIYPLFVLENRLKPDGFVIGSDWDYEEGFVDLNIDDQGIKCIVRIPFYAVAGSLDYPGVTVRVNQPLILIQSYQKANEVEEASGMTDHPRLHSAAGIPDQHTKAAERIMKKVEGLLFPG